MRKSGVPKAVHLTRQDGRWKALLIPRDADKNARGWGEPLVRGGGVKAYVRSIWRVNTGSQTHISFPKERSWYRPSKRERLQDQNENRHPLDFFSFFLGSFCKVLNKGVIGLAMLLPRLVHQALEGSCGLYTSYCKHLPFLVDLLFVKNTAFNTSCVKLLSPPKS